MNRFKQILLWVSKIIISLGFLLASSGKLGQSEAVIQLFRDWGYVDGFYLLIGVLEFGLAILVLIPKTSLYAALALLLVMMGAIATHILNDPLVEIVRPVVFMAFLSVIIVLEWDKRKEKT